MTLFKQYYKKAIEILKNLGFVGGNFDPCLYVKKSAKSVEYVALYVDINLMAGDMAATGDAITALKRNRLILMVVEGLWDYLSCKIKFSKDEKGLG